MSFYYNSTFETSMGLYPKIMNLTNKRMKMNEKYI